MTKNQKELVVVHVMEPFYDTRWQFPLKQIFASNELNHNDISVLEIVGERLASETTQGGFTNFIETHFWKNSQANQLFSLINSNKIPEGSVFFFDDAWNTNILQLKYIMDLVGLKYKIIAFWHAGVHDEFDFLGRLIKDKDWAYHTERALFNAIDKNCFATNTYKTMFINKVFDGNEDSTKVLVTAQPHNLLVSELKSFPKTKKENLVVFQHRLATEKQPEIFRDLANSMPDVDFVVCQDTKLTKNEYYKIVSRAKVALSVSLQETFGIACSIDAPMLDCIPLMPNRLSYQEIFEGYNDFLYPSEWTLNWNAYIENKDKIISALRHLLFEYYILLPKLKDFCSNRLPHYTVATDLINEIDYQS
jgi:hypothetical protein